MDFYEEETYLGHIQTNAFVLPGFWETRISEDRTKVFYKNTKTKETQWKIPQRIDPYDLSEDYLPDDTEKPLVGVINKSGLPNLPEELIKKIYEYNDEFVIETYNKLSIGLEKFIKESGHLSNGEIEASIDMIRVKSYLKEAKLICFATSQDCNLYGDEVTVALKSIYSYEGYYVLFTYSIESTRFPLDLKYFKNVESYDEHGNDKEKIEGFDLKNSDDIKKMSKQLFKVIPKNKFNYVKWLQDIIGVIPVSKLHKEIYGEYWIKPFIKYINSLKN
jgi:hypothetical protein